MHMNHHRDLEKITCLAWNAGPRAARREQARVIGALAADLGRRARRALDRVRRPARRGVLDGAA